MHTLAYMTPDRQLVTISHPTRAAITSLCEALDRSKVSNVRIWSRVGNRWLSTKVPGRFDPYVAAQQMSLSAHARQTNLWAGYASAMQNAMWLPARTERRKR